MSPKKKGEMVIKKYITGSEEDLSVAQAEMDKQGFKTSLSKLDEHGLMILIWED